MRLIIDVGKDEELIYAVEEVLKQLNNGNTSGIDPTWEIENE